MADGGRSAARGLRYQYLRTLEALMDAVERRNNDLQSVHIEGRLGPDGRPPESVDYEASDSAGNLNLVVQVKSRAPGSTMGAGEIFGVLATLVEERDARRYELLTNALPGPSAGELLTALNSDAQKHNLRVAIDRILDSVSAERRQAKLRNLTEEHLLRLRRAIVSFDTRDDAEIIESLIDRVRLYRNKHRTGLGNESAGLMIGYLVDEIFKRASDARAPTLSIAEFESLLTVPGATLVQTLGYRDWGVIVGRLPSVPDVRRVEHLAAAWTALPLRSNATVAARCTLTGLSGIGKTSLAASYILDRADVYNAIFWADAESEQTLVSSFERFFNYLHEDEAQSVPADPSRLRDAVHTRLSQASGPWLMILDNCADSRLAEFWAPVSGPGHVIMTTTDSSRPPKAGTNIEIGTMDVTQATTLLSLRLTQFHKKGQPTELRLRRLAIELECWPLALELAAAYLHGSGLGIDGIPEYIRMLKMRSLGHYRSVPADYPRTLIQAISLCLERIDEKASPGEHQEIAAAVAINIIKLAAYMASQRIPVYLLMSTLEVDPGANAFEGIQPVIIDDSECPAAEVVTVLRSESLISLDEPLPFGGLDENHDHRLDQTISVNTVLQEVIRAWLDQDPTIHGVLDRLAWHTERWMKAALEWGQHLCSLILAAHGMAVEEHAERLNADTDFVAYLRGNLGTIYMRQQNTEQASALLRKEIHHFVDRPEEHARLLTCQASMQLASILCDAERIPIDEVMSLLERAYLITSETSLIAPEGAAFLASTLRSILRNLDLKHTRHPNQAMLTAAVDDLLSHLPQTEIVRAGEALIDAEAALQRDDPQRAANLCREVLSTTSPSWEGEINAQTRCEAHRFLVEALVRMDDLRGASAELDSLLDEAQPPSFFIGRLEHVVQNAGLYCATVSILGKIPLAADLLRRLLSNGIADLIESVFPGDTANKIRLLRSVDALAGGDIATARRYLDAASPILIQRNGDPHGREAWRKLGQIITAELERRQPRGRRDARPQKSSQDAGGNVPPGEEPQISFGFPSSSFDIFSGVPVELVPLYAALSLIHSDVGSDPKNVSFPVCYQLAEALDYLGFDSEVLPATTKVFARDDLDVPLLEMGLVDQPPSVEFDGTTDGHFLLWTVSFSRLIDPTITQTPRLMALAEGHARFSLPIVLPIDDLKLFSSSSPAGAVRDPFIIAWKLTAERRPVSPSTLDPRLKAALSYGGLLLAHSAVRLIRDLRRTRADLSSLDVSYPQLQALLSGGIQLPSLPPKPPQAFFRLYRAATS
jgi:hypothetical protein